MPKARGEETGDKGGEEKKNPATRKLGDVPGGPVVKTLNFQCRGHMFNPWSGDKDLTCLVTKTKIF